MDESFCKGKFDGSYNDPSDCRAYYQCLGGSTIRSYCPGRQVFNAVLKTCDNPANFPCQQKDVVSSLIPRVEKVTSKIVKSESAKDDDKTDSDTKGK